MHRLADSDGGGSLQALFPDTPAVPFQYGVPGHGKTEDVGVGTAWVNSTDAPIGSSKRSTSHLLQIISKAAVSGDMSKMTPH